MPRRRCVLVAAEAGTVAALRRCLSPYDVEVLEAPESALADAASIRGALYRSSEDLWTKALFREETRFVPQVPATSSWDTGIAAARISPTARGGPGDLVSRLTAYQLPQHEQRVVREANKGVPACEHVLTGDLDVSVHEHRVPGFLDPSSGSGDQASWDEAFLLAASGLSLAEAVARGGHPPCSGAASKWVAERLHYTRRRTTNFIRKGLAPFQRTISFREEDSVGAFLLQSPHLNSPVALACGLHDAFVSVANNGSFFRSSRTRREVNYWLPGLNAGMPLTPKRDPIHEITFAAHDFCHFLVPDLIYTGLNGRNVHRTYVLYRMMSEAVSCVMADMLFVEALHQSGYQYNWTLRRIHPLLVASGVRPLEAGSREGLLERLRLLLEANVEYCLMGETSKFMALIRANGALDIDADGEENFSGSAALEGFKEKYMPFFVEDYRWTDRNFRDMASRAEEHQAWWSLVQPLAEGISAAGGQSSEIGLETIENFMAAIGVQPDEDIASEELIWRVFDRVFQTRIEPVFLGGPKSLASEGARRTQAFVRYMMGQCILFVRHPGLAESQQCSRGVVDFLSERLRTGGVEAVSEADVASVRGMYEEYLQILERQCLITPDDVANYSEICPLFEPSFAFYDEEDRDFYAQLKQVQREILEA